MGRCDLFGGLTAAELDYVSQLTRVIKCSAGQTVFESGEPITPAAYFYLVHSGTYVATLSGGRLAREYGPLDNFGACELLVPRAGGRECTVTTRTAGVLWGVPKEVVEQKLRAFAPGK